MGFLRYYWLVIRTASTHALGVTQDILFVIYIIGGGALYALRGIGMISDVSIWMTQITGWQIATAVMALIIGTRIVLAPYWIYKEKCKELANARKDLRAHSTMDRVALEKTGVADFAAWDRVDVFLLRQAAQLWAGERPSDKEDQMSQMAQIILRELVSAANYGDLKATAAPYPTWIPDIVKIMGGILGTDGVLKYDDYARVTRDDLRAYALGGSDRPPFLFPESR